MSLWNETSKIILAIAASTGVTSAIGVVIAARIQRRGNTDVAKTTIAGQVEINREDEITERRKAVIEAAEAFHMRLQAQYTRLDEKMVTVEAHLDEERGLRRGLEKDLQTAQLQIAELKHSIDEVKEENVACKAERDKIVGVNAVYEASRETTRLHIVKLDDIIQKQVLEIAGLVVQSKTWQTQFESLSGSVVGSTESRIGPGGAVHQNPAVQKVEIVQPADHPVPVVRMDEAK